MGYGESSIYFHVRYYYYISELEIKEMCIFFSFFFTNAAVRIVVYVLNRCGGLALMAHRSCSFVQFRAVLHSSAYDV